METQIQYDENKEQKKKVISFQMQNSPIPYTCWDIPAGNRLNFTAHWHSAYEIHLLLDGYAEFFVNGELYRLSPGDALFIHSNSVHGHADASANYGRYLVLAFEEEFIFPDTQSFVYNHFFRPLASGKCTFTKHIKGESDYEKQVLSILHTLFQLSSNKCENALSIQIYLLHIFDIMIRENAFDFCKASHSPNDLVKASLIQINQNYNQNISVEEMAQSLNISTDYFSRIFKAAVGSSPKKYILNLRIRHAIREMKQNPDANLSEIAFSSGFGEQNYFARVFKKYLGISPSEYRQSLGCSAGKSPNIYKI